MQEKSENTVTDLKHNVGLLSWVIRYCFLYTGHDMFTMKLCVSSECIAFSEQGLYHITYPYNHIATILRAECCM